MNLTLVCISGPSTGHGALMRGKFVLAKHGQSYESKRLSSSTLTTDINIRTVLRECIAWEIGTLPTWLYVGGAVSQGLSTNDAFSNNG